MLFFITIVYVSVVLSIFYSAAKFGDFVDRKTKRLEDQLDRICQVERSPNSVTNQKEEN
jgi:hypothetical protein